MEDPRAWPGSLSDSVVRSQLERILRSDTFKRSERLSAFLRFVAEQTLAGQGASLKEQTLGLQFYCKGPKFDGAADPIVRVDARRLRDKLREYYAEFPGDPIVISLPKGTYVPSFVENPALLAPAVVVASRSGGLRWLWISGAVGLAAALGSALTWLALHKLRQPVVPLVLTTFPGQKGNPALSPDGAFVAFSSKGPEGIGENDIWVKAAGNESLRRLTQTPQFGETAPAWSPDGREIAFVRAGQGVFIVPVSGGAERKVSSSGSAHIDWTPDGKSVLIRDHEGESPYAIYQVFLDNLQRRRLTQPQVGVGDWRFSVSPDGSKLGFIRYERPGVGDLYLLSLHGGEPRRLTNWNEALGGLAWTPDGAELIYSKAGELWRIPVSAAQSGPGSRLRGISVPADNPSISRPRQGQPATLAFQSDTRETGFRVIDLAAPLYKGVFQAVRPFVAPAHPELPGTFSRDGSRFTFLAGPSPQLWSSSIDGAGLRQIVSARVFSSGSWSPDGRRILYDAAIDGNSDIFVIDAVGGQPRRLTFAASLDAFASWSRDGRWVYFSSTRAGPIPDIWRIPSEGGAAVRITYHGGLEPRESSDGRYLYYVDRPIPGDGSIGTAKLMQVPVAGGPETALLDGLTAFWWSLADSGIFFISRQPEFDAVDRYGFRHCKVERLGHLGSRAAPIGSHISVSPDGRWLLVGQQRSHSELMLLGSFR